MNILEFWYFYYFLRTNIYTIGISINCYSLAANISSSIYYACEE